MGGCVFLSLEQTDVGRFNGRVVSFFLWNRLTLGDSMGVLLRTLHYICYPT
jgi:hypothetical protein